MLQKILAKNVPPPKLPGNIVYHKPRIINSPTVDKGLITPVRADVLHVLIPKYTTNKNWKTLTTIVQGFKNTILDLINKYVSPHQLFDLDRVTAGADHILLVGVLNANSDIWGSSNTIPGRHLLDQLNRSESIVINDPKVPITALCVPPAIHIYNWHQN